MTIVLFFFACLIGAIARAMIPRLVAAHGDAIGGFIGRMVLVSFVVVPLMILAAIVVPLCMDPKVNSVFHPQAPATKSILFRHIGME